MAVLAGRNSEAHQAVPPLVSAPVDGSIRTPVVSAALRYGPRRGSGRVQGL